MKRQHIRRIAILLTLCLILANVPVFALAAETGAEATEEMTTPVLKDTSSDLPGSKEDTAVPLDKGAIESLIDAAVFQAQGFTSRRTDEESMNSYIFQKPNGERTMYIFTQNVKFVKDGQIVDKDLSLVSDNGGYSPAQNDVDLFLPANPAKGIVLHYEGVGLRLLPQGLSASVTATEADGAIVYGDAFGPGIDLKYTPQLSGMKEDILLSSYVENASYSFVLETVGLSAFQDGAGWYLAPSADAAVSFRLGSTLVYDAVGKPTEGTLSVQTIQAGAKYRITVGVADSFLSDPATVYPVTIDPTITVSDNTDGAGAIEDAPIFQYFPKIVHGNYIYNRVGTPSSTYGIGRTVVRLTGLIGSETYQQLMADQITSVKFYAKEASGGTSQFVNLHPLTNTAWTEATVTWANIGAYDTSVNYGANMFNNQFTAFDITGLVKAWKAGTYSEDAGFILTHSDETKNKAIYSSEYGNAAFRPYVELTYIERGSGGGNTFAEATEVLENLRDDITIAYAHEPRYFYFTPTTTGFYTFESYDLDGDPYITLYNSNQQELKHLDDGQSQNFELCYHLIANMKYYFAVSAYDVHSFSLSITLNYSYFVPDVADFSWSSNNSVSTDVPYKVKTFKYRPSSDTTLVVFTQRSSGDPKLWIYDRNMDLLIQNDDGMHNGTAKLGARCSFL